MTGLPSFQAPSLKMPGIEHHFFTRQGGKSTGLLSSLNVSLSRGDSKASVEHNRSLIAAHVGCESTQMIWLTQTHSSRVHYYQGHLGTDIVADALITKMPYVCLCIQTADCAPILIYEPHQQMIAAIHAGWRGALNGVIDSTIHKMVKAGCHIRAMRASIGPCIHQDSYQVDTLFYQNHVRIDPQSKRCFTSQDQHYYFNLPGYCHDRLARLGLSLIESVNQNTYSQEDLFFSCRRAFHLKEATFGTQASCIMITTPPLHQGPFTHQTNA